MAFPDTDDSLLIVVGNLDEAVGLLFCEQLDAVYQYGHLHIGGELVVVDGLDDDGEFSCMMFVGIGGGGNGLTVDVDVEFGIVSPQTL